MLLQFIQDNIQLNSEQAKFIFERCNSLAMQEYLYGYCKRAFTIPSSMDVPKEP